MNRFQIRSLILACSLALAPASAYAAKLGGLTVTSKLGEPFSAEIRYTASPEEMASLSAHIAPAEVYAEQGITFVPAMASMKVDLAKRADGTPVVRLSSPQPHGAPFLDLLVQLEWATGQSMREYSTVPNLPVLAEKPQVVNLPPPVEVPVQKPLPEPVAAPAPAPTPPPPPPAELVPAAVIEKSKVTITEVPGNAGASIIPEPVKPQPVAPPKQAEAKPEMPRAELPKPEAPKPAPVKPEPLKPEAVKLPAPVKPEPVKTAEPKIVTAKVKPAKPSAHEKTVRNGPDYLVRKGDTLRSIAARYRADGVTLEQILVGIFVENKNAFIGNNINRLKAGHKLHVPTMAQYLVTSPEEARKEVQIQTADWEAYRLGLAAQVRVENPSAQQPQEQDIKGKVATSAQKPAAKPQDPRDVVKVGTEGGGFDGKVSKAELAKQLTALQEDAIAKDKMIKEQTEKREMLEKQVQKMKQLLEIKNKMLAQKDVPPPSQPSGLMDFVKNNLALVASAGVGLLGLLIAIFVYFRIRRERSEQP